MKQEKQHIHLELIWFKNHSKAKEFQFLTASTEQTLNNRQTGRQTIYSIIKTTTIHEWLFQTFLKGTSALYRTISRSHVMKNHLNRYPKHKKHAKLLPEVCSTSTLYMCNLNLSSLVLFILWHLVKALTGGLPSPVELMKRNGELLTSAASLQQPVYIRVHTSKHSSLEDNSWVLPKVSVYYKQHSLLHQRSSAKVQAGLSPA